MIATHVLNKGNEQFMFFLHFYCFQQQTVFALKSWVYCLALS